MIKDKKYNNVQGDLKVPVLKYDFDLLSICLAQLRDQCVDFKNHYL
jgi:hypothetical protein